MLGGVGGVFSPVPVKIQIYPKLCLKLQGQIIDFLHLSGQYNFFYIIWQQKIKKQNIGIPPPQKKRKKKKEELCGRFLIHVFSQ